MYKLILAIAICFSTSAQSAETVRWTYKEDTNTDFNYIVQKVATLTGYALTPANFVREDDRDLATSHYSRYLQVQDGLPVKGMSLRIWKKNDQLIQMEAWVENPTTTKNLSLKILPLLSQNQKSAEGLVNKELLKTAKLSLGTAQHADEWTRNDLVRTYQVLAREGRYQIEYSFSQNKIISSRLLPYPNKDLYYSVPAQVYPIYEEVEETHAMQTRVPVELNYLLKNVQRPTTDPFENFNDPKWKASKMDDVLGSTPEGQAQGFWSYKQVLQRINSLKSSVPYSDNTLASGNAVLAGKYTTIRLHPDVYKKFGVNFGKAYSTYPNEMGEVINNGTDYLVYFLTTFYGKPFSNVMDLFNRPAVYDPLHSPATYINAGFDEVQVYYAVTKFFESLKDGGFTDPELSERPFQSILFDPAIEYRDNAFYWNDTINFTTYSKGNANYARDNTTIWHELGHGLMDRLLGTAAFDGNPGFSEGFADFTADLIISDVTQGKPFEGMEFRRSNNNIGFYLTNEEHDDGEAYGGVLRDILLQVTEADPKGLLKMTDLTLEMMRFIRHHPDLTAGELYNHLLFADELGHEGIREPGELRQAIVDNFMKRNFDLDETLSAKFNVSSELGELTSTSLGSRYNPIVLKLSLKDTKSYTLQLEVKDGQKNKFRYPVTVKATFNGSPLQGNVHYQGEEQGAVVRTFAASGDTVKVPVTVTGQCDGINTSDDGCKDYIHILVFNNGADKPVAKKRFYVKVNKP